LNIGRRVITHPSAAVGNAPPQTSQNTIKQTVSALPGLRSPSRKNRGSTQKMEKTKMKVPRHSLVESNFKRTKTSPIPVVRSRRMIDLRGLTSLPAGKMVPINAFPVLREDAVINAPVRLSFEMMETAEILINAVNVRVMAYFVPWLALWRFQASLDQLNRSYEGLPPVEGGDVVDFVAKHTKGAAGAEEIYTYLGLHAKEGDDVSTFYRESYNRIWNFRARNRSSQIEEVAGSNTDLLPAFWAHRQFQHVVPDFDQDMIDGEVALNVTNSVMPVQGIGALSSINYDSNSSTVTESSGDTTSYDKYKPLSTSQILVQGTDSIAPNVFVEMQQNGITVSLANIELAKKTAAFARLKEQYAGLEDDYIVDLLMKGVSVPDQALKQPILMADKTTVFGMQKRYATDSGNLAESAVNGAAYVDLNLRLPQMNVGGTVMIVAEITPEQMFERQKDPYFHLGSVDDLPDYLRDTLDPEKVEVVTNDMVDVDHDAPADAFGYAPLNWRWNTQIPRIGGKFYRPDSAATFDEDRQRLWVVETQDPTFAEDFYLATNINQSVFADTLADPFECTCMGAGMIEGLTVFGGALHEASTDYEDVLAEAPQERIEKE
jgi:hypothetical protein